MRGQVIAAFWQPPAGEFECRVLAQIIEIIGDVAGKSCVMVDDMIDTAGSMVSGACALMERGARRVYGCATHAVLSGPAVERIENSPICELIVTDTIPQTASQQSASKKITVISVASLLANAILRIHTNDSVSELFESYW